MIDLRRHRLKSKIISSGYWTVKDFAKKKGNLPENQLCRIVTGKENPGHKEQKVLAKALKIKLLELRDLL